MGRKPNPGQWHVLASKDGQSLIVHNPAVEPPLDKSAAKLEEIASFKTEEDATQFAQLKILGIKPDAAAFLLCEHELRQTINKDNAGGIVESLQEHANNVHQETGRTCFGRCQSLDGAPACATCFAAKNDTWQLCANVRCVAALFGMEISEQTAQEE